MVNRFILIGGKQAKSLTARWFESLHAAASAMKLDPADVAAAIEAHGRVDTDTHTLIQMEA